MDEGGGGGGHAIFVLVGDSVVADVIERMLLPLVLVHKLPVRPGAGLVEAVGEFDGQQHLLPLLLPLLLVRIPCVQLGDLLTVQLVDDTLQEVVEIVRVGGKVSAVRVRELLLGPELEPLLVARELLGDQIPRLRMRVHDGEQLRRYAARVRHLGRRFDMLQERRNGETDGLLGREDLARSLKLQLHRNRFLLLVQLRDLHTINLRQHSLQVVVQVVHRRRDVHAVHVLQLL
mmetsp:Transcript_40240/g.126675  ORF Transcript_40240/g.126675 Transcript_40240/m.126675 type:complete len:232 (+) Transcript_40240:437-1132(+)